MLLVGIVFSEGYMRYSGRLGIYSINNTGAGVENKAGSSCFECMMVTIRGN